MIESRNKLLPKAARFIKILIHSNAPWTPTGYGQQTAMWATRFQKLGHEVIISAYWGLAGAPSEWNGIKVLPGSGLSDQYGSDLLPWHFKYENPDVIITLCDIWVFNADVLKDIPMVHWIPVDCRPLGALDKQNIERSGATVIAFSRHGERMLQEAGFDPYYVPHGVDTTVFAPLANREELRKDMKVDDRFIIGIAAANKDPFRKGMAEQFEAFARLHQKHPDTILMVHGLTQEPGSVDLASVVRSLDIRDCVNFVDQYQYFTGQLTPEHLATWYSCLDVYSMCSFGEGFGLTAVEAQACGTPVVASISSSMPEVCGVGWLVEGQRFFNPTHRSWWRTPSVEAIYDAYESAYRGNASRLRTSARSFSLSYDADYVLEYYWEPVLEKIEKKINRKRTPEYIFSTPKPPAKAVEPPEPAEGE